MLVSLHPVYDPELYNFCCSGFNVRESLVGTWTFWEAQSIFVSRKEMLD